jgi:deazaflavin-dependent oxidoreductase (nitroreductase family)
MNPVLRTVARTVNTANIALYRRSKGRVGGTVKGHPVLLLTVPGRKTGKPRTVPVLYLDHDGGYLIAGTAGGLKAEPQWMRNLKAADRAHIQIGDEDVDVNVRIADDAERDRLWRDVVLARAPFFAKYEEKSGRVIPIAVLTRG